MKLTEQQLKEIIHGAYDFKQTEDGYIYFSRYTDEQLEYLKFNNAFYDRATFSASVTIEFFTAATSFGFLYKSLLIGSIDSVDVYVNGQRAHIQPLKDAPSDGRLAFSLPIGEKKVVVYLPIDMRFAIKDFHIDGEYRIVPKRKTKVLWIGDSITQGYGSAYSSDTYVNAANRFLEYDVLNQGIGGYYYDYKVLKNLPKFPVEKIIIALGINGHTNPEHEKMITEYYQRLVEIYPTTPILVLTPLWAKADWIEMSGVLDTARFIRENTEKYPQIKLVDGFNLIPHSEEYFIDGVHPNEFGMNVYADNLVREIKKIGF